MSEQQMHAGPELDAEIARRVFCEKVYQREGFYRRVVTCPHFPEMELIPAYSSDIAAAWAVVERMQDRYFSLMLEGLDQEWKDATFMAVMDNGELSVSGSGRTFEEAICRAALAALGDQRAGDGEGES